MHWDDLRIFLAVARAESISGAGRGLHLDPATVGRRIARLEEEIGALLFVKSPSGYALTAAGQRLVDHAERAEQAVIGAREELRGETASLTGQVRIGAPDGCANYLLPQVCARLVRENPGLEIQIVALPRVFNLSRREADMAVAVSQPRAGRATVQKITDYRLSLAASRDYLATHDPIRQPRDLHDHPVVGYIPEMIFDKELDYLSEFGAERVDLASNSVSVQLNMIRQGGGVGMVHDFALPFAPELRRVLPGQVSLTRAFYLIRHADDRRVERLNRLAAEISTGLSREVERLEAMLDSEGVGG